MAQDFTLRESIQLAIKTEQLGSGFYTRMARRFADSREAAEVFSQLAEDERTHEEQFKKILDKLPREEPTPERYELQQFLRATAISEFFQQEYFQSADEVRDAAEALGRALGFEKATLQYYQAIRDLLGENRQLDAIIHMERSHVLAIVRILPTDARFRGLGDSF